jgi:hypothetical protein
MDENDRKERFSLAYISAVAAHAGYQIIEAGAIDKDSIDGTLLSDEEGRPRIEFQAKATSLDILRGAALRFRLSIKNYDDLRVENAMVPRLLIVVVLPAREEDWLVHTEEELRLRRSGYWLSLTGLPATSNRSTVTVTIPRAQVLDTTQLRALMDRANRGELL